MDKIDCSNYLWAGVRDPKIGIGSGLKMASVTTPGSATAVAVDTGKSVSFIPDKLYETVFVAETHEGAFAEMSRLGSTAVMQSGVEISRRASPDDDTAKKRASKKFPVKLPVRTLPEEIPVPDVVEDPEDPEKAEDVALPAVEVSSESLGITSLSVPSVQKVVKTCLECGGSAKGRGFTHKAGCSKGRLSPKPVSRGCQVRLIDMPSESEEV